MTRQVVEQRHDVGVGLRGVDRIQPLGVLVDGEPPFGHGVVEHRRGLVAVGVRGAEPGVVAEALRVHAAIVGHTPRVFPAPGLAGRA
jgi:hypothetical protein